MYLKKQNNNVKNPFILQLQFPNFHFTENISKLVKSYLKLNSYQSK